MLFMSCWVPTRYNFEFDVDDDYFMSEQEGFIRMDLCISDMITYMDHDRDNNISKSEFLTSWNPFAAEFFKDFKGASGIRGTPLQHLEP